MLELIQNNLLEILGTILVAIASYIGTRIKNLYEEKVNTDTKKKVVETVVNAVEQLYRDLDGAEKFDKCIENATSMLNEKGITISDLELRMLIESVVNGFNSGRESKTINNEEYEEV